ncbi:hypothetical protein BH11PSE8_BH11PSE8_27680 [soil metagenome]
MSKLQATVVGEVMYREGDGIEMTIPLGACEIDRTALDATLTWADGDSHGAAAIPLSELDRFIQTGALVIQP